MPAYYNEIDPFAADWLRNLIVAGYIAPGDVDERDIQDISPNDLKGYTQVHFFAGIGIWSAALREAGVRDDEPIWTGSCPCQPFSAAGKGGGFDDERHLWPAFHYLIEQCRPARVFGEQVASPDGLRWLDLVQDDMEGAGYAFGAADTCAAGALVGFAETGEGQETIEWIRGAVLSCPDPFLAAELRDFAEWSCANLGSGPAHIRQRLYWVADATGSGHERRRSGEAGAGRGSPRLESERLCDAGPVADADERQRGRLADGEGRQPDRQAPGWQQGDGIAQPGCSVSVTADANGRNTGTEGLQRSGQYGLGAQDGRAGTRSGAAGELGDTTVSRSLSGAQPSLHRSEEGAGTWDAQSERRSVARPTDWIVCTDGKARPIKPGTFPLAHGYFGRVGILRAAGNAINKAQAVQFIRAVVS